MTVTLPPASPPPGDPAPVAGALPALDRLLDDLPGEYCVACHDVLRLAIGPTGVFVLSLESARPDLDGIVTQLLATAARTRDALADHLSFVPFVDALLVLDRHDSSHLPVTGVPLDLLRATLVEGRRAVPDRQLDAARQLLRDDRLRPWAFCLPGDTTIDLSDSVRHASSRG